MYVSMYTRVFILHLIKAWEATKKEVEKLENKLNEMGALNY